ncbi:hypothetical protein KM915_03625 [Cytobacillus oceanisediminis]|uniref:hypothetical protein n=1 Tax=Cytobacillus oceanisediminis TaxID=665099 RepID=UPI001C23D0C6|nr:hypothetical protein [Cytobacillus oceanisediminis]MBU8729145.1 hypothetical protein [Cytobacillus oceanisediminis]
MNKEFLLNEILRYVREHKGKIPNKNDMKKREGYPTLTVYKKFFKGLTWNQILVEAGINPNTGLWSKGEDEFLLRNFNFLSDKEIANHLGRTVPGVSYRRKSLKLLRQSPKKSWEKWEIEYLKENFYGEEQEVICERLHPRLWETIRAYATKNLGLRRKNKNYKYQTIGGKRICKRCERKLEESESNFYRDGDGFRTLCKRCYSDYQEEIAREKGVLTKKYRKEMWDEGFARCGKCEEWKSIYLFRNNHNDLNNLHRWCESCEASYLKEYNLKKKYGLNYQEMYIDEFQHLIDLNGNKWDSLEERDITNWLILNKFVFRRGPTYKNIFKEHSRRRFDWVVEVDMYECFIEYFGLWDTQSSSKLIKNYTQKAKRKIKKLYKNRFEKNFIIIFPSDLNKMSLREIFSKTNIL